MKFDLALLLLVALFGALGAASGAIKQLSHWAGVLAAYLLARPIAAALAPKASAAIGLPPTLAGLLLSSGLFLFLYAVAGGAAHWLLMKAFRDRELGTADRSWGFALGAGKATALGFAALSGLLLFETPGVRAGAFERVTDGSRAVAFVRTHNLFSALRLPALDGLRKSLAAAKHGGGARGADAVLQALLKDPRFQRALKDPSLRKQLDGADASALADDPRVKALVDDPDLAERMSRVADGAK